MKDDYYLIEVYYDDGINMPFKLDTFKVDNQKILKAMLNLMEKEINSLRDLLSKRFVKAIISVYGISGRDRKWFFDKMINLREDLWKK